MYIQYTSVDLACLLIYQVSRVILLQWPFPLLQKHLVPGLGSTLGLFTRAATDLPFHEVSLLALALLETNGLELWHQIRFWNIAEHMRCSKDWNGNFILVPTSRGIRPPTSFLAYELREKSSIVEHVLRLSEYYNHLNRVGVNLLDEIVMFLQSHCHQATRASWWTITYQG